MLEFLSDSVTFIWRIRYSMNPVVDMHSDTEWTRSAELKRVRYWFPSIFQALTAAESGAFYRGLLSYASNEDMPSGRWSRRDTGAEKLRQECNGILRQPAKPDSDPVLEVGSECARRGDNRRPHPNS